MQSTAREMKRLRRATDAERSSDTQKFHIHCSQYYRVLRNPFTEVFRGFFVRGHSSYATTTRLATRAAMTYLRRWTRQEKVVIMALVTLHNR